MHDHTKQQLEVLAEELQLECVEIIFNRKAGWSDLLEKACYNKLKQSLKSQAEMIMGEIEAFDIPLKDENTIKIGYISCREEAVRMLDKLINSFE